MAPQVPDRLAVDTCDGPPARGDRPVRPHMWSPEELTTDAGHENAARALIAKAEDGCLVTVSLDLPVQTTVNVRAAIEAA